MGGFYTGSEDAEVENLLNQLEEDSLLKLKVNSHRTTTGVQVPSNSSGIEVEANGGLDDELLARFAKLKSRPAGGGKVSRGGGESTAKKHGVGSSLEHVDGGKDDEEEEDELSELEMRLNALKSHGSGESLSKKSPFTSPSPKSGSKMSFSPMKLVKQLSMGKKKKSGSGNSISDADKLLASAADELILESKNKTGKVEVEVEDESDLDEEEDECDDRLLKDLNLKKLKKELRAASLEEDRLSREAQQVIEWAKDAALLESATSTKGEDCDMEELLKLAEDQKLKKKKKGKKWNLF